MNTQEMKSQILNGILSSTPSIIINGVEVKLPTPQRAGTNTQMRAYAEMKTTEIFDQLRDANEFYKSPTDGFMWRDVTEDCLNISKRDELFAAHELFEVCDDDTDHLIEDANDINAIIEGGAKICIEYNNIK